MFTHRQSRLASRMMSGLAICGAVLTWACNASQPRCEGPRAAHAEGSWRLAIRVPDSVRQGDAVPLALVLQNVGESAIDPQLGLPSDVDFVVTRPGDTIQVWRKLHGFKVRMGALLKRVVAPGDSVRIEERWDQRGNDGELVRRGVYCVRGNLTTEGLNSLRTEAATIRIVP